MGEGTLIDGRYALGEVIGYGGMATVYCAEDRRLSRPVAVKVLADNLASDPAFRERFEREARMAASLTHRNIVQVFDVGEGGDGRPFIVMEYVDGETLADALRRDGRLSRAQVADLAAQVGAGLAHAHEHGLVHRDVKPGNLLIAKDGTVKITDFGIARAATGSDLTRSGAVLGTAAYVAPEQAAGQTVGPAADVYALGLVLRQALTGVRPDAAQPSHAELDDLAGASLAALIDRTLASDPALRPRAAEVASIGAGGEHTAPLFLENATADDDVTAVVEPTSVEPISVAAAPAAAGAAPFAFLGERRVAAGVLAALAAAAILVAVALVHAHDHASRVTAHTGATAPVTTVTTLPPTTAPTTTEAPVAVTSPPQSSCGNVVINVGGIRVVQPNPNCQSAGDGGDSQDSAGGATSGAYAPAPPPAPRPHGHKGKG